MPADKVLTIETLNKLGYSPLQYAEKIESLALERYFKSITWGQALEEYQQESQKMHTRHNEISDLVQQLKELVIE